MSFLSAGLISEPTRPDKSAGSGLLGVVVGFVLILFVVAVVSFIRLAIPPYAHFGPPTYAPAIQYDQGRSGPYDANRMVRHDVQWRFEYPRHPGCRN